MPTTPVSDDRPRLRHWVGVAIVLPALLAVEPIVNALFAGAR